jgi:hypothetical protein
MFIGKALDKIRVLDRLHKTINCRSLLGAPQYKNEAEKVGISFGTACG